MRSPNSRADVRTLEDSFGSSRTQGGPISRVDHERIHRAAFPFIRREIRRSITRGYRVKSYALATPGNGPTIKSHIAAMTTSEWRTRLFEFCIRAYTPSCSRA